MTAADISRILTIELGIMMIVITTLIVIRHTQLNRIDPREGPHLLPLHVATIAASFVVLACSGMVELVLRIGESWTWRIPVLFLGFGLANIAQAVMYSVVKTHLESVREKPTRKTAT